MVPISLCSFRPSHVLIYLKFDIIYSVGNEFICVDMFCITLLVARLVCFPALRTYKQSIHMRKKIGGKAIDV